jgi:hypothetical protein
MDACCWAMGRQKFLNGCFDQFLPSCFLLAQFSQSEMAPKKRFKPQGSHSGNINRWLLKQAQKAKAEGVSPLDGDFAWTTFQQENEVIIQTIAEEHPGPADDRTKLVRANFHRQVERFRSWLLATVCCW